MKQLCWLIILILATSACSVQRPPKQPYNAFKPPLPPDYSDPLSWAALPETYDFADTLPRDLSPKEISKLPADVFFIHPTTFLENHAWNAQLTDKELNLATDSRAIKHQATAFNEAGRLFAPRYRQMGFGGFFSEDKASTGKALELAYHDIKAAFSYYLEHYYDGRPVIISAHSQGSFHSIRLLKEFFDGQPLQEKLVAAYLIGWPIRTQYFQHIPVCETPDQTGCFISWCSWKEGEIPYNANFPSSIEEYYQGASVVNPLTWTLDTSIAPKSAHEGLLLPNYKSFKSQQLTAQVRDGYLWVSKPLFWVLRKNYHIGDINLFWLDIRHNVALRVDAYQKRMQAINN